MSVLDDSKLGGKAKAVLKQVTDSASSESLDWFAFETRIRKVLYELLEPTADRSIQAKEAVEKIKSENEFLIRKIEELEFILHKSHKRSTLFDNVNKRLIESDSERKMLEVKIKNDFNNVHAESGAIKDKITILEEEISNLVNRVNECNVEDVKLQNKLIETRDEFTKEVNNSRNEHASELAKIHDKLSEIHEWQKLIDSQMNTHREELNRQDISIEKALRSLKINENNINITIKETLKATDFKVAVDKLDERISMLL